MKTDTDLLPQLLALVQADDLVAVQALLEPRPGWLFRVGRHSGASMAGALGRVRTPAMAELLVDHGLDLAVVSAAWASGIGLGAIPGPVAERWVARGATLSVHAAAALGLIGPLRELLDAAPDQVGAPGGDGCHPLHFARTVAVAELLLERGAELDARDDDHDSTPAQWRIGEAPDVTRFLLQRGATPDLFMAAGLGDEALARRMVAAHPECTTDRIGNNSGPFPGIGFQGRGGTIYQWTLGFHQSPQEIAWARGHRAIFDFLMSRTPPRAAFLIACAMADRVRAEDILARHPGLRAELTGEDLALLAKCCWETNLNPAAVRLMLDLGFPVAVPEHNHGFLPLHNAAWCGHAGLVELLLQRGHPVDVRDPQHQGTPLDWALHSCVQAGRHPEGEFARVLTLLLAAGATVAPGRFPTGRADLDDVLRAVQRP